MRPENLADIVILVGDSQRLNILRSTLPMLIILLVIENLYPKLVIIRGGGRVTALSTGIGTSKMFEP